VKSSSNSVVVSTREGAHVAITRAYDIAKGLIADGRRVRITVDEDNDPVSVKQRRFLHGPVLEHISHQVVVGGQRYVMDVWKEHFRKEFLGFRWECIKMPGDKRATPRRIRNSTEELGVKKYSDYIDRVIAHATTEWSVAFRFDAAEREAVRYRAPASRAAAKEAETC